MRQNPSIEANLWIPKIVHDDERHAARSAVRNADPVSLQMAARATSSQRDIEV
jgi:hypothetical protein